MLGRLRCALESSDPRRIDITHGPLRERPVEKESLFAVKKQKARTWIYSQFHEAVRFLSDG